MIARRLSMGIAAAAALATSLPAHGQFRVKALDPSAHGASVASDGDRYLVVGTPCPDPAGDLCARFVDARGDVAGEPIVIADDTPRGIDPTFYLSGSPPPDVTYAHGMYFVVWLATDQPLPSYRVARVRTDGVVLDPGGILLSIFPDPNRLPVWGWAASLEASHDGEHFLAVWSAEWIDDPYDVDVGPARNIWAVRVTRQGEQVDPTPIRMSRSNLFAGDDVVYFGGLSVASSGASVLAAFEGPIRPSIHAHELDATSGVSEQSIPFAGEHYVRRADAHPAATYDGSFLVLFTDFGPWWNGFLPTVLTAWRPDTGERFAVLESSDGASGITTAFDGRKHLVLWGGMAVRMLPDGTLMDPDPVSRGISGRRMATNGRSFLAGASIVFDDLTPPSLTAPSAVQATATSTGGAKVTFQVSAWDDLSGLVPATCDTEPGALFPPGSTTVTCTASDEAGNVASASFPVAVTYAWSGVLAPFSSSGLSLVRAGYSHPVKFRLTEASAAITNLAARLTLKKVTLEGELAVPPPAGAAFRYDPWKGYYVTHLALEPGAWRIGVEMDDGVVRSFLAAVLP